MICGCVKHYSILLNSLDHWRFQVCCTISSANWFRHNKHFEWDDHKKINLQSQNEKWWSEEERIWHFGHLGMFQNTRVNSHTGQRRKLHNIKKLRMLCVAAKERRTRPSSFFSSLHSFVCFCGQVELNKTPSPYPSDVNNSRLLLFITLTSLRLYEALRTLRNMGIVLRIPGLCM